jgi:hypothetical protein
VCSMVSMSTSPTTGRWTPAYMYMYVWVSGYYTNMFTIASSVSLAARPQLAARPVRTASAAPRTSTSPHRGRRDDVLEPEWIERSGEAKGSSQRTRSLF